MPLSSFFRKVGKTASDNLVGVASGTIPMRRLDNPRFYRSIVVLGLLALIASGWLVFRSIVGATALPRIATTRNTNTSTASAIAALNTLKSKDTDADTISDYDELYSTHTSPYLKDSDGDGTADGTEIQQGADPNCPKGKTCEGFRLLTSITDQNGNLTPEFLRRALASAGVPQTTLDGTNDASLLSIYREVTKTSSTTNTSSNANISAATSLEQIQQLTPAAIRQLLIQNGLDAATLNSVDDETLRQIFQEAVNSSDTSSNTNQ